MSKKSKAAKKEKAATVVVEYPSAPVVLPPRLYRPVEDLCRDALHYSDNAVGVRESIRKLVFAMRALADQTLGHVAADALVLEGLLKRTDSRQQELAFKRPTDPIEELHRQAHLNPDQRSAALLIRRVWGAWGRHLTVVGHGFDSEGGGARTLKDPWLSMDEELWDLWRRIYVPWYEAAKKIHEPRESRGMVAVSKLVISIVMEPIFPGALDSLEHLKRGTCLRVLKQQLTELSKLQEGATLT